MGYVEQGGKERQTNVNNVVHSIVAVHGLSGDWEKTWANPDTGKLWLRDFIASDDDDRIACAGLRVLSFGYDKRRDY